MVNKIRNGIVWVRTPKCATSTMAVHLQNFCEWKDMNYTQSSHHGTMAPKNCSIYLRIPMKKQIYIVKI